jgi:UDP-N-acetylmuramoyl-L-alanyl-D-glutamate--2,6-diaminopimelate ligase
MPSRWVVEGLRFDVGIFLNLGHDHRDFHGTQEAYLLAKRELLTPAMSCVALVNVDDRAGRRLHADADLNTQSFSVTGRDAHWRAVDIDLRLDGSSFTVIGPDGQTERFTTPWWESSTSATSCRGRGPRHRGSSALGIRGGDCELRGRRGAGPVRPVDAEFQVVIDAGHKPEAINALLRAMRPLTPGRIITVIGSNGNRDAHKRPLMGRFSAMASDIVIVTDDNPADEDPRPSGEPSSPVRAARAQRSSTWAAEPRRSTRPSNSPGRATSSPSWARATSVTRSCETA